MVKPPPNQRFQPTYSPSLRYGKYAAEPKRYVPSFVGNHELELKHKAIVDRYGRYPHRNAILGRASTPEEIAFLQQPGSRF